MQRTVRAVLFFVFAFFCGGAVAEAQINTPILQGTANYYAMADVYPDGEVWKSGMIWEVWGNLYYSKTSAHDVRVGGFTPQFNRGGTTIPPYTLSYAATGQARGNVSYSGGSSINTFYANLHDPQNSTKLTFSFPEHTLPKLAPGEVGASVTVRFFMQGNITHFASYTVSVPPQHPRIVSGYGTATLTYHRRSRVMAFRFRPNTEIYLASVNFTFDTLPPPQ